MINKFARGDTKFSQFAFELAKEWLNANGTVASCKQENFSVDLSANNLC
jgi:hypothetical protein